MPTIIEDPEDLPEGDEIEDADSNDDESSDDGVIFVEAPEAGKIILPDPVLGTTEFEMLRSISDFVKSSTTALEETTDTDQALEATIMELYEKIDGVRTSIDAIKVPPTTTTLPPEGVMGLIQVEDKLKPIREELDSIKNILLPELEASRASLKTIEGHLQRNAVFIATAVEYGERLDLVKTQYGALEKRVTNVEATLDKSWDRRLTIIASVTAVISLLILTYVTFIQ